MNKMLTAIIGGALLSACAFMVSSEPARLAPLSADRPNAPVTLTSDVSLELSTGYTRTLPAKSEWRPVGALPQGTVYQRVAGVFSIEGRHVHEAYLVIKDSVLQGFYLPGEAGFSPLTPTVSLPLGAR